MVNLVPSIDIHRTVANCMNSDVTAYQHAHRDFHMNAEEGARFLSNELKVIPNYTLYDIKDKSGALVGMIGIESDFNVHPFFIKPKFRRHINAAWNLMKTKLAKEFIMCAYATNLRGIRFYEKKLGQYVTSVMLHNQDLLIYKFENRSI